MLKKRPDLITTTEAARLLGVSCASVQSWVEKGRLRALKTPGGHRRIARDSVDGLLQEWQHSVGPVVSPEAPLDILVVEDDPVLVEFYAGSVESWEFPTRLRTAKDGFEGIFQVGRQKPDIILTDLKMPGMDGFQMVRALKSNPELTGIRIIVVTVLEEETIEKNGGLPSSVKIFHKPPPMGRVKTMARDMIQRRRTGIVM